MPRSPNPKARYWILTVPQHLYVPYRPVDCTYIGGQLERGETTGYLHWQLIVVFTQQVRLTRVKTLFGDEVHAEVTRSEAAREYCFKESSAIEGTAFHLGQYPFRRNNPIDWEAIKTKAKLGLLDDVTIPAQVYVNSYGTLKQIKKDHLKPEAGVREIFVYCGKTGAGKSKRAWEEAGWNAYPKQATSKYWDGYQEQENVVMDEFRGQIGISHMLAWCDRYPVIIDNKFGATCLKAKKIWITSNLHPNDWYPDLDAETKSALIRRLNITEFN